MANERNIPVASMKQNNRNIESSSNKKLSRKHRHRKKYRRDSTDKWPKLTTLIALSMSLVALINVFSINKSPVRVFGYQTRDEGSNATRTQIDAPLIRKRQNKDDKNAKAAKPVAKRTDKKLQYADSENRRRPDFSKAAATVATATQPEKKTPQADKKEISTRGNEQSNKGSTTTEIKKQPIQKATEKTVPKKTNPNPKPANVSPVKAKKEIVKVEKEEDDDDGNGNGSDDEDSGDLDENGKPKIRNTYDWVSKYQNTPGAVAAAAKAAAAKLREDPF